MTYITQLTGRKAIFSSRILTMVLAGFVLVILQSSTVHAQWTTNGNNINNTNTGNVGIGTTSPALPLDVRGNSIIVGTGARALIGNYDMTPMAQGVGGGVQFGGKFHSNGTLAGFASISGIKENATDNDFSSALVFTTRANPNTQTEKMRISSSGNVGIGTTSPGNLLHLNSGTTPATTQVRITANGLGSLALLTYAADNIQLGFDQDWSGSALIARNTSAARIIKNAGKLNFSGNTGLTVGNSFTPTDRLSIDLATGNVGIGTANPIYSLDVNGGINGFRAKAATVSSNDAIATFENASGIQAIVRGNGNVGIGMTAPTAKLHVAGDGRFTGNLTVDGNIAAKYQDVAEWVQSSQELAAGTVVVLDHTKSNQVIASSQAYDTRVAGVISLQPGITLGEKGESKVLVATMGRVKVKVDATAGPIQVGDLLVTSDKEGVAKKSEPLNLGGVQIHRPGTLIGKALEPLEKGTGEILVLLSLQ